MQFQSDNFFRRYFHDYIGGMDNTESSITCHRWSAISILGAYLGRQFWFPFADMPRYPNQYIQIIGVPSARKSTAIKQAKRLLKATGYNTFASDKTSKEKFLVDLHDLTWGTEADSKDTAFDLDTSVFGSTRPEEQAEYMTVAQMYIASDEFVNFIGYNNMEFISLLGDLWDYDDVFSCRLKNSKPVYINRPTINIIAGNTPMGFNKAFPPEIQHQGFFARLLLIHAAPTGRKVYSPRAPNPDKLKELLGYLQEIKQCCVGQVTITPEAHDLLEYNYMTWQGLIDHRFESYNGRRNSHLEKLCLVVAASRLSSTIEPQDVLLANTLLTAAEYHMPKAMGEFGMGRFSEVAQRVLDFINASHVPVKVSDIVRIVINDLDKQEQLHDILRGLHSSGKIQVINGFYCPNKVMIARDDTELLRPSWLEPGELIFD